MSIYMSIYMSLRPGDHELRVDAGQLIRVVVDHLSEAKPKLSDPEIGKLKWVGRNG